MNMTRSRYIARLAREIIREIYSLALVYPLAFLISVLIISGGKVQQAILEVVNERTYERNPIRVESLYMYLRHRGDALGKYNGTDNPWQNRLRKAVLGVSQQMAIRRAVKYLERKGLVYTKIIEGSVDIYNPPERIFHKHYNKSIVDKHVGKVDT